MLFSYYRPDGALDLDANARQIDYALASGADGITLLGLASEGGLLTGGERLSTVRAAAMHVPRDRHLLVTLRADDDADAFADAMLEHRAEAAFICQVGTDPAAALAQCRALRLRHPQILCGLQLAPGLIEGSTATAGMLAGSGVEVGFIKAEYGSIELAGDMARLAAKPVLLVGRHGLNLVEYLRIGAAGVIPGTEMTAPLVELIRAYRAGQVEDAIAAYGRCAPYVDFAMQDLATVIAVGRAVTGIALGLQDAGARGTASVHTAALRSAIDVWGRYWTDTLSHSAT